MAEEPQSSGAPAPQNDPKASQPMFWLAFAALFAMLLLAVVALTLVSKNSSTPQINVPINVNSNNKDERPPVPQAPQGPQPLNRPDRGAEPDAHRMSGQQIGAPQMLPGALATPTIVAGMRDGAAKAVRADTQSPPYYATLNPVSKVPLRVRGIPAGPSGLRGPVPFRVHEWSVQPDGKVEGVQASVPAPGSAEDPEQYSYLPEVHYKAGGGKGKSLSLKVMNPRKTSVVNDLRSPKGFQFLVAEIQATNVSKEKILIDPDMFEILDSDQVSYLPNPELLSADFPSDPLSPGKAGKFTAAFLVPADSSLMALRAHEPKDGLISSPLSPQ